MADMKFEENVTISSSSSHESDSIRQDLAQRPEKEKKKERKAMKKEEKKEKGKANNTSPGANKIIELNVGGAWFTERPYV